eukprot:490613-Hanusia_phi.AAC.1
MHTLSKILPASPSHEEEEEEERRRGGGGGGGGGGGDGGGGGGGGGICLVDRFFARTQQPARAELVSATSWH